MTAYAQNILKTCTRCKSSLPTTDFHKDKSRKDGLNGRCKKCHVAGNLVSSRKQKNPDYVPQFRSKEEPFYQMPLTVEAARMFFLYDPETGVVYRKADMHPMGYKSRKGYLTFFFGPKQCLNHRFAWFYVHGIWPEGQIDHINGIRDDNRLANLRCVSGRVNSQNRRAATPGSITGFLGVSASGQRFIARIKSVDKCHYLGCFATAEEAHRAYIEAKRQLHEGCTL